MNICHKFKWQDYNLIFKVPRCSGMDKKNCTVFLRILSDSIQVALHRRKIYSIFTDETFAVEVDRACKRHVLVK